MNAIVVGNAPYDPTAAPLGELIDSFDQVIRINNFRIEGHELHRGTRCDISCMWSSGFSTTAPAEWIDGRCPVVPPEVKPQRVWIVTNKASHFVPSWALLGWCAENGIESHVIPRSYRMTANELGGLPAEDIYHWVSTGAVALYAACKYFDQVSAVGFDAFQSDRLHYWEEQPTETANVRHPPEAEKKLIEELKREYGLRILDH